MKTLRLHKFIAITLCVTLLAVSAGKVTRVSAVGTTAAIAGTAFILTGAVYLSYVALTQGEMVLPAADEMHNWLGSIGRKVSQYPSGAAAYQEIYEGLQFPVGNVIDGVWTWTQDRIKDFVNDFSDTRLIGEIIGYEYTPDTTYTPTNGFEYAFNITPVSDIVYSNGRSYPLTSMDYYSGPSIIYHTGSLYTMAPIQTVGTYRNYKASDGTYSIQILNNGVWTLVTSVRFGGIAHYAGTLDRVFPSIQNNQLVWFASDYNTMTWTGTYSYPLLANVEIYDSVNDEYLPLVIPSGTNIIPTWNDPDNDNRPIIPWVPIPQLPVNVNPPSGYVNPQWGFSLQDLLDTLEDLATQLMDISAIASLINQFAGLHGDNYYLEYNDGSTNYYTYYQPTIYDNDNEYVTYNIDVSDVDEKLPVDLNTIQIYTKNRYLDEVKRSAIAGSSILRDLVVFVYDIDPGIVYVFFGSCIAILVAAFIGKWGHS